MNQSHTTIAAIPRSLSGPRIGLIVLMATVAFIALVAFPAVSSAFISEETFLRDVNRSGATNMQSGGTRKNGSIGPGQNGGKGSDRTGDGRGDKPRKTRNRTKCKRRGAVKVCTYFKNGKAVKRCKTKRNGRRKCVKLRAARLSGTGGNAATLDNQGFFTANRAIVKILRYDNGKVNGSCSGTVVSRTMVLTAAHCIYKNGTFADEIAIAPGMVGANGNASAPYGVWQGNNWWAPSKYTQGDSYADWGLIEIAPSGGQHVGDVTGSYPIHTGLTWDIGQTRVIAAGYPSSGFFSSIEGGAGQNQYSCDGTYDGYDTKGSGYDLWMECTMNRGSSGGPWFREVSSGNWAVVGINNWCFRAADVAGSGTYCDPYSDYIRSSYFEDQFIDFWNTVQGRRAY